MLEQALSKIDLILNDARKRLAPNKVAAIEQVYKDIENLNDFINTRLNEIEAERNLDHKFKKPERRKVFEQAGRKLETIKEKRDYSALIEELESKLKSEPVENKSSIFKFLREREIRDRLVGMTTSQIMSHFGVSLFDGSRPLLLDAILNAPPGLEMLPENTLKRLLIVRGKKSNPKVAAELMDVRKLNFVVVQMLNIALKELDNLRRKELPKYLVESEATQC